MDEEEEEGSSPPQLEGEEVNVDYVTIKLVFFYPPA